MENKEILDTLMIAIDNAMANMHTATIAKVTTVNATTINCRPVVNRVIDGESIELPEFIEVPPLFMSGGTSYTAHPIAVGDYCLLIFTERCFDTWYAGRDYQAPAELRMHDYSDGLAIVGLNPLSGAIPIPAVIQRTGDSNHDGNSEQTGDYTITGDIIVTGNVIVSGEVTALSEGASVGLSTHLHTGNLGAPTSPPTGGT